MQVNGTTILYLFRMLRKFRNLLVFAASTAVWRPGSRDTLSRLTMLVHAENELTTDRIITKMRDGDRLAQLVWRRYIDRLARGWHSR